MMKAIKNFMNKPVTWGDSFKWSGIVLGLYAAVIGACVAYEKWTDYKAEKEMLKKIPIDIIVGTFLIVGLTEDDFGELLPEFVEKYEKMFHQPRKFVTYTDSEGKVHLDVDYCTPEE